LDLQGGGLEELLKGDAGMQQRRLQLRMQLQSLEQARALLDKL
jgi:hypothetical protein